MFAKYGVLSRDEMKLRVEVLLETYGTQLGIEARTMLSIGRREILPAALRHQADLAEPPLPPPPPACPMAPPRRNWWNSPPGWMRSEPA